MTSAALFQIIDDVNEEHRKKLAADGGASAPFAPPGMPGMEPRSVGLGQGAAVSGIEMIDQSQWNVSVKSGWLYTYLIGKKDTELHTKTINIQGKKGFEGYRQNCNVVDAVPEN